MPFAALDFLTSLYGTELAARTLARLEALLAKWRERLGAPGRTRSGGARELTQSDVLLITYADQVRDGARRPLEVLGEFATRHLAEVVSGVHLLPFYPWSSDDGFSVKDYSAVDPAYGTWEDIAQLGRRFDLMFDAVFNHLSAQSGWFQRFLAGDPAYRDFFVTVTGSPDLSQVIRPRALPLLTEFPSDRGPLQVWTTFSADQVDLNVRNPEVLLALIDVLLDYVARGARFVRLDAIAFLWKEVGTTSLHRPQTHRIIQLLRAVVDDVAPGTRLITETNVPHVDNLSYFGDGTNEASLVYNFALPPLVLHTLSTGDASRLTRWAAGLTLPSREVAMFNFLASHDGIGVNPARGILSDDEIDALVGRTLEHGGYISYKHLPDRSQIPYEMNISYFDALSHPAANEPLERPVARMLAAHAIAVALAGVPGLYFHSLFGSRGDRAGADASGIARRINRQKLERAELERELADDRSRRARVFAGMRRLLAVRRREPAFHPGGAQQILATDPRLFVVLRTAPDSRSAVLAVQNISEFPVTLATADLELAGRLGEPLLVEPTGGARASGDTLHLAPYAVFWVRVQP